MSFSFSYSLESLSPTAGPSSEDPYGYGVDYSTFSGDGTVRLDLHFAPVVGPTVVAQRVVRRWLIPREKLYWDPSVGVHLPAMVNADWTPDILRILKTSMENEAKKEDGCVGCVVSLTADARARKLTANAVVYTKEGQFPLTVTAGDAVSVLFPEVA